MGSRDFDAQVAWAIDDLSNQCDFVDSGEYSDEVLREAERRIALGTLMDGAPELGLEEQAAVDQGAKELRVLVEGFCEVADGNEIPAPITNAALIRFAVELLERETAPEVE